jgi:adenylate kinase
MAPITDQIVDDLKSLVSKLEKRVAELESKASGTTHTATEQMRMVLMGPPGAGKILFESDGITRLFY